jgi:hypothetical protein
MASNYLGMLSWSGRLQGGHIVDMAMCFYWCYKDGDKFNLVFKLCGDTKLLLIHTRCNKIARVEENFVIFNCASEQM